MIRPLLAALTFAIPLLPAAAQTPQQGVDHTAIRERSLAALETQFAEFRDATAALSAAAVAFCDAGGERAALEDAFRAAWLAWAPLDSYQFGPVEQSGAALTVNFWPDKKNFVGNGVAALLALPPDAQRDPAAVAEVSAAGQGLPALERLLYTDIDACPAAIGVSANLAAIGQALFDGWFAADGWAELARQAGPENPVYLSDREFTSTLFTAADFGLTRVSDYRLGRPIGTFERSYPRRAEAWRSGLSAEIAGAQVAGVAALIADGFGPALPPESAARFADLAALAQARLEAVGAPVDAAVVDQMPRLRLESVQTRVTELRRLLAEDLGPALGVETGFSAADGD